LDPVPFIILQAESLLNSSFFIGIMIVWSSVGCVVSHATRPCLTESGPPAASGGDWLWRQRTIPCSASAKH